MAPGREAVPDLLIVLDSSRSMEGPKMGTKTHRATLAAFKACQFAHSKGAEIAAINFSEKYLVAPWTRDLNRGGGCPGGVLLRPHPHTGKGGAGAGGSSVRDA